MFDLANAALFAPSNLLDGDGANNDLTKPTAAARNRRNKRGARLSADRASVLGAADWGTMISRRRLDGGFFQGTRRTMRSGSSWPLSTNRRFPVPNE